MDMPKLLDSLHRELSRTSIQLRNLETFYRYESEAEIDTDRIVFVLHDLAARIQVAAAVAKHLEDLEAKQTQRH